MNDILIGLASVAIGWILFFIINVFDPVADNFAEFMRVLVPVLGVMFFIYLLTIFGNPL